MKLSLFLNKLQSKLNGASKDCKQLYLFSIIH